LFAGASVLGILTARNRGAITTVARLVAILGITGHGLAVSIVTPLQAAIRGIAFHGVA